LKLISEIDLYVEVELLRKIQFLKRITHMNHCHQLTCRPTRLSFREFHDVSSVYEAHQVKTERPELATLFLKALKEV